MAARPAFASDPDELSQLGQEVYIYIYNVLKKCLNHVLSPTIISCDPLIFHQFSHGFVALAELKEENICELFCGDPVLSKAKA